MPLQEFRSIMRGSKCFSAARPSLLVSIGMPLDSFWEMNIIYPDYHAVIFTCNRRIKVQCEGLNRTRTYRYHKRSAKERKLVRCSSPRSICFTLYRLITFTTHASRWKIFLFPLRMRTSCDNRSVFIRS